MCGLVGLLLKEKKHNYNFFNQMVNTISHRGPDYTDTWISEDNKVLLGHTRLSILDLSKNGNQPMTSFSGRYVIIYNGEIYNHLEIRKLIEEKNKNFNWKSQSDTETLINSFEVFGVEETLKKSKGMFAFALWDKKNQEMILARDRMGEKPLYYGWTKENFVFASELKAIKKFPGFDNQLSEDAISSFFQFSYIQGPSSIYKHIYKLEPGKILRIKKKESYFPYEINELNSSSGYVSLKNWWSLEDTHNNLSSKNYYSSELKSSEYLEKLLLKSVKSQLISDVPIGCFLSGGIDSSLITALMQRESDKKIKTFTIGFEDKNFDETIFSRKIAEHLNTDHNELKLTDRDAYDLIPSLPKIYDEPFADSSQIPTYFVSKFAKTKVSVSLSGDGGDELFGGYNRYFWSRKIWKKISFLPFPLRKIIGNLLLNCPKAFWGIVEKSFLFQGDKMSVSNLNDKSKKLATRLKSINNLDDLYLSLISEWREEDKILINPSFKDFNFFKKFSKNLNLNYAEKMMFLDKKTYLSDDILCKVDRASMANSLETRAPFLDNEIVEFASNLPTNYKIRGYKGKIILRNILKKFVPEKLFDRPKMGFGIPLNKWLNAGLKEWVFDTLNINKIKSEGIINHLVLEKILNEHFTGKRDWETKIWIVLMFQSWLDSNNQ